jgi:hypothetical protein
LWVEKNVFLQKYFQKDPKDRLLMAHSENAKLTKGSHHLSSGCGKINDIHVLWIFTSLVS